MARSLFFFISRAHFIKIQFIFHYHFTSYFLAACGYFRFVWLLCHCIYLNCLSLFFHSMFVEKEVIVGSSGFKRAKQEKTAFRQTIQISHKQMDKHPFLALTTPPMTASWVCWIFFFNLSQGNMWIRYFEFESFKDWCISCIHTKSWEMCCVRKLFYLTMLAQFWRLLTRSKWEH